MDVVLLMSLAKHQYVFDNVHTFGLAPQDTCDFLVEVLWHRSYIKRKTTKAVTSKGSYERCVLLTVFGEVNLIKARCGVQLGEYFGLPKKSQGLVNCWQHMVLPEYYLIPFG